MTSPLDLNTVAIITTLITLSVGCALFIQRGFRDIERAMYRLFHTHRNAIEMKFSNERDRNDAIFKNHSERIMRAEISVFGNTINGPARSNKQ